MLPAFLVLFQVTSSVVSNSLPSDFFWLAGKEEFKNKVMHHHSASFTSFDVQYKPSACYYDKNS